MLYNAASGVNFIMSDEHLQLFSSVSKLVFDDHSKMRSLNALLECFIVWLSLHSSAKIFSL